MTMRLPWYQLSTMDLVAGLTVAGIALWLSIYVVGDTLKKADYFREPPSFRDMKIKRGEEIEKARLEALKNAKLP